VSSAPPASSAAGTRNPKQHRAGQQCRTSAYICCLHMYAAKEQRTTHRRECHAQRSCITMFGCTTASTGTWVSTCLLNACYAFLLGCAHLLAAGRPAADCPSARRR
jgi:hypothetical protein